MKRIYPHLRPLALVLALVATVVSLYLSEIMHLPPCVLCWYQRVMMYPLVIILAIGLLTSDKKLYRYSLPLTVIGLVIATYHNLLYYHIIPEYLQPCVNGISCTSRQLDLFGFVTIPLMSLAAFAILTVCLLGDMHHNKLAKKEDEA